GLIFASNFNSNSIDSTTILDASSGNNHGTVSGATWGATTGFNGGGAYNLDGTNTLATGDFGNPSVFTVSWWHNPNTTVTNNQQIGVIWGAFMFHASTGGAVYCGINMADRFEPADLPVGTLQTGVWQQLTFTYNGTTGVFYKNGKEIASKVMAAPTVAFNGFEFKSGGAASGVDGYIDGLKIYGRALSEDEVSQLYNQRAESLPSFVSQKDVRVDPLGNVITTKNISAKSIGTTDGYDIGGTTALYADIANSGTVVGLGAGDALLPDGMYNTAVGHSALSTTTTGDQNTAIGMNSLFANTTGSDNTANGMSALRTNINGTGNNAFGVRSLYHNSSGSNNIAVGNYAMYSNVIGENNIAMGRDAMYSNSIGMNNTVIGSYALYSNSNGNGNAVLGYQAGYDIVNSLFTGYNVFIGYNTGRGIVTGVNNTIIGANVTGLAPNLSKNIIIADGAGNQRINVDNSGKVSIQRNLVKPNISIDFYEEFIGSILPPKWTAQGLGSVVTMIGEEGGSYRMQTAAVSGRNSYIDLGYPLTEGIFKLLPRTEISHRRVNENNTNMESHICMMIHDADNSVSFRHASAEGANFIARVRVGGVNTDVDTGISSTAVFKVFKIVTNDSFVTFFIDDTQVAQTVMPVGLKTLLMQPRIGQIETTDGIAKATRTDWVKLVVYNNY
ncbi:MAG: LamG-like jellyroll fold domain-containing protein, partial [Saprospiraceae bacterium]